MKRTYFHTQLLWPGLFFGLCAWVFWYIMKDDHYSFSSVAGFVCCLLFVATSGFLLWYHRHDETIPRSIFRNISIEIGEQEILFPEGYYFKHSVVDKEKRIPAGSINEVWTSPYPTAIVINGNEVIFLKYELKEELLAFAERNSIPVSDRTDIWGLLCEPYLDTSFEPEELEHTKRLLAEAGMNEVEMAAIRKKIEWLMSSTNYYRWEWQYLGQFDYLHYARRTATRYWWTMEIALKNFAPHKGEDTGNI